MRRETGKEYVVKVHFGEGVASHTGPESCGAHREVRVEALTGGRIGWVLSRESSIVQGADAVASAEGNMVRHAKRVSDRPCVVADPSMCARSVPGNREISPPTAVPVVRRPASGRPEGRSR